MITLFAVPRPFKGKFNILQRNAIKSWLKLGVEVILFGNDKGVSQVAKEFNIRNVASVQKNNHGTPILSDVFRKISRYARYQLLAYINCDMILLPDFMTAVKHIGLEKYLLVGQRRPLHIAQEVVGKRNWVSKIRTQLIDQNSTPVAGSSDYFVYPRNIHWPMPPFALGRLYWDKWFFYHAKSVSIPIIDATRAITAIHQQHYSDVTKHGDDDISLGDEAQANLSLIGGKMYCFSIFDADYLLTKSGVRKKETTFSRLVRKMEMIIIIASKDQPVLLPLVWVARSGRVLAICARQWWKMCLLALGK